MVAISRDDYDVKHVHSVGEMAGGWNSEAMKALLGIWGDSSVQSQLDGVVRNVRYVIVVDKYLVDQ